jgi:hypothetical protein
MSGSYALTVGEGPKIHRPVPIVLYDDRRFGSFSVAEPDSSDPASFDRQLRFLMRKGRSREDAEDLIQEAMLRSFGRGEPAYSRDLFGPSIGL